MPHRLTLTTGLYALAAVALVYAAADPLDSVFARIDAAAKSFKGMTADISDTDHTALVDSDDVQQGIIKLLRAKDGTHMLVNLKGAQSVALDGQEARVFYPKTNIVDVYNLANRQSEVNQYLLLGFGATSAELKATYDITYVGEEKVGGQTTTHLKLIPKSADTRHTLKQADLWFGSNGLVTQQKFLYSSGNFKLFQYSNIKLGSMPEKELELKLPKGVTVQKH